MSFQNSYIDFHVVNSLTPTISFLFVDDHRRLVNVTINLEMNDNFCIVKLLVVFQFFSYLKVCFKKMVIQKSNELKKESGQKIYKVYEK